MKEVKVYIKKMGKMGAMGILASVLGGTVAASAGTLSKLQREHRLDHAQELLGKYYGRSVVRTGEQVRKINNQVYIWTFNALPKRDRKKYKKVAQTIIDESLRYEFDPVLLLSVIKSESDFNPRTIGGVGEIGLMQIRPMTGEWMSKIMDIPWKGKDSLFDPILNIKIGAAYLAWLRDMFDSHARLYLAAYNMGQGNVKKALRKSIWPKDYPRRVMENYVEFYHELREEDVTSKIAAN